MFNVQRPHANNTKHAAEPCTLANPAPWPQLDWQSIDLNITWLARAVVCMQPWMLHCVSTVIMCSGTTRSCQIHTFHITVTALLTVLWVCMSAMKTVKSTFPNQPVPISCTYCSWCRSNFCFVFAIHITKIQNALLTQTYFLLQVGHNDTNNTYTHTPV